MPPLALRRLAASVSIVAAAPAVLVGLAVPAAHAATAYRVTVTTNHAAVDVGERVQISGRVTGGPVRGRSVVLFWTRASQEDSWHRIGTAALGSHGRFARSYRTRVGGDIAFRAVKARVGAHPRRSASTVPTAVYQWQSIWPYWFEGLGVVDGLGGATGTRGPATVNGRTYAETLVVNDGARVGLYTYECKAVRGLVGVVDGSTATSGSVTVRNAGLTVAQVGASVSQPPVRLRADLDPTDGLTVQALVGSTDGSSGGTTNAMVLARPQALCDAPA